MTCENDEKKYLFGCTEEIFGFTQDDKFHDLQDDSEDDVEEPLFSFAGMAPRISIQNEILNSAYGSVSRKTVINVNGFIYGEPLTQAELSATPPKKPIDKLIEAQDDFYDAVTAKKRFLLKIVDHDDSSVKHFYNAELNTLDFEEGSWIGWCRFKASFTAEENKRSSFIEFQETFNTSRADGLGYINLSDKSIEEGGHTTGTYSVTARASDSHRGVAELTEFIKLDDNDSYNVGGVTWRVFVENTDISSNPTTGEVSLNQNLILVPDQGNYMDAIASYSESRQTNSDSAAATLSISGEFKCLGGGWDHSEKYIYFKEFADQIFSNALNSNLLADSERLRGISGVGRNDMWDTLGSAISKNTTIDHATNTVTYQVDYDISNYDFIITNATKQDINISLTPQRTVYAAVPVIGKSNGPVLQNTYSVTEASKSLSLDVTFLEGKNRESELESIQDLLSRHEPQALTNYNNQRQIFGSIESETSNHTDNTFSMTVNWVYLPSRLQTFIPSYSIGWNGFSNAPFLPTSGALDTGGGWTDKLSPSPPSPRKYLDYAEGGDTLLPRSRQYGFVTEDDFRGTKDDNGDWVQDVSFKAIYNPISVSRLSEHEGHIGDYANVDGQIHLLNIFIHNDDRYTANLSGEEAGGGDLSDTLTLAGDDAGRFLIKDAPPNSYDDDWADRGKWKALYLTAEPLYPLPNSGVVAEEGQSLSFKTKYVAHIYSKSIRASERLTEEAGETVEVKEYVRYNLFVHKDWKQPEEDSMELTPASKTLFSDIFGQDYFLCNINVSQNQWDQANESAGGEKFGHITFYMKFNKRGMFKIVRTGKRSAKLFLRSGTTHQEWSPDDIEYDDDGCELSRTANYIDHYVQIFAKDFSTEKEIELDDNGNPVLIDDTLEEPELSDVKNHKEMINSKFFHLRIKKPKDKHTKHQLSFEGDEGHFNIHPMGQINDIPSSWPKTSAEEEE